MDGHVNLITTLTGGLSVALILGFVSHWLKLSPIVGYLVAGIFVGPYTPGMEVDHGLAEQLAEVGVILLMFGVGLHFHFEELLAVRRVAIPGAIGQSVFATLLGAIVTHFFGWEWGAGIVFGLALSVASTVVLVRVLADNRDLHTPSGHIAVGWLVVEDLFTVLALVLMPVLFGPGERSSTDVLVALGLALLKVGGLVAIIGIVGTRVIPWILDGIAATRSRELFTLTVLVIALGIAVGSAQFFGVSMALGAFLAGMVVGRSEFSQRAAAEALPMRDAFAVLFFVSVGMLFNPFFLLEQPVLAAATLAIVMIGKPLAAFLIVFWLNYPPRRALAVSVALAQIGEFSFIMANVGKALGVLPDTAMNTLVATAIVSITLNPLLYRLIGPMEAWAARQPKLWAWLNSRVKTQLGEQHIKKSAPVGHRAIVVGFGPVGATVSRLLQENDIEPAVIELNVNTVRRLRADGIEAVYGDATQRDILQSVGIERAGSLILSSAGMVSSEEVIRVAREMNPNLRVIARTSYVHEQDSLLAAGAERVFSGEGEVALAMTVFILEELGATPEQVDRERARVHEELFRDTATAAKPRAKSSSSAAPAETANPAPVGTTLFDPPVFDPPVTSDD